MTVWDNAFEISPANSDAANQGAAKIRELKTAISERLELEMNFKTGTKPLVKAGIASVCYPGNTAQINALSSPANYALAFNTQTKTFMYYNAGWANAQIDHDGLANLTGSDPHTQYLNLTKASQTLSANLSVANNITIDGVDISSQKTACDIISAAFMAHDTANASDAHTGGIGSAFGSYDSSSYAVNTVYTASTDGFVVGYANTTIISFYTPNGTLMYNVSSEANHYLSVCCPVRKGISWRMSIVGSGTNKVSWLPIGS